MNRAQSIVAESLEYIERHLRDKFVLDDIAQNLGVSRFHLDRIFKSLTGEPLMSYATARKLSSSIGELINTKERIIDIALDYGFEYEQSYIRAFKKMFGRTPFKVRAGGEGIEVREKIGLNEILAIDEAITYRPFFVMKPAFQLVGMRYVIPEEQDNVMPNQVGRDFFYQEQSEITHKKSPHIYIGYVEWNPLDKDTVYIPSVQVGPSARYPEKMVRLSIPTHQYAVFRFVGFFHPDQINFIHFAHLIEYMYQKWIVQAGYEIAAPFRLETIDTSLAKENYCELDLYQPIRARKALE